MKNTFAKKFTVLALVGVLGFALTACDDSSSAGDDDNNVILSGDSREESSDSRSNDKDEAISSSGKVTDKVSEPAEGSSSSVESSDSKSSSSVKPGDSSSSNKDKSSSSVKSSSSEKRSSSSMSKEESSSSVIIPSSSSGDFDWSVPKEAYLNPEIQYDSIIDERDGQVYKTVKIGEQVWMAQNLNYADSIATPSLLGKSRCYDNVTANCEVTGRFYKWSAAMDSIKTGCGHGAICSPTLPVQGICPSGWHLPDTTDWKTLIETVGDWSNAGKALKSVTGWLYFESVDSYGFSALPGGFLYRSGTFDVEGSTAYLWVATENTSKAFYAYSIVLAGDGIDSFSDGFKDNGYSIRCIKD